MSGVLHPVGPEPERVYWVRRSIVAAAAVLALVLVIAVVANLNNAASASGPEVVPAAAPSSSAPAAGAAAEARKVPSFSPAPTAAPSGKSSASTSASSKPSGSTSAGGSASPSASPSASGKSTASADAKASDKTTAAAIAACDPDNLRPTLTGDQSVKVKKATSFDLSLINGGSDTCLLKLDSDNFTLTIYSGSDRIWSTADCADLVKPVSTKLKSEDAYEWSMAWDGRRSKSSCKTRPEIPRAGTYVATAHYDGADPVTFRMFLKK